MQSWTVNGKLNALRQYNRNLIVILTCNQMHNSTKHYLSKFWLEFKYHWSRLIVRPWFEILPSSSIEYQNILMWRNISYDVLLHSNELIFTANIANCQDLYMHTSFSFIVEFHYEEWYIIIAVVFFISKQCVICITKVVF